ncbi:hypothetical protein BASA50_009276 [Batrachochytrium salamandrivorans]|uniref:Uncharacterized protein n=1 Tax=Batrachochytrium salamandrivorans TaxID=1357716 RepID=A0ABQ8F4M9_9FUNG|nr:hypothetical protein BASA50_009276 [Batrachochytrium salamandrivorans]
MLVSSVITLLVIGSTSVSADKYDTYNLLKDDRAAGRLVFIPTTLAQKEVILSNVKNALAIWVNYRSKIDHYGSAADPFPIVKKLRENINTVSDEELQLGITDAFAMTRDRHTRWTNMPPYSCFYATTDVEFTFIEGDDDIAKNPTVVVTSTSEYPDLHFIKFQFKSHANPEIIYTVDVPYVSGRNEECWNLGSKLYKSLPSKTLPGTPETGLPVSAEQSGHNHKSDTAHLSPRVTKWTVPRIPKERRTWTRSLVPGRSLRY